LQKQVEEALGNFNRYLRTLKVSQGRELQQATRLEGMNLETRLVEAQLEDERVRSRALQREVLRKDELISTLHKLIKGETGTTARLPKQSALPSASKVVIADRVRSTPSAQSGHKMRLFHRVC